jgi:hypothetical protein
MIKKDYTDHKLKRGAIHALIDLGIISSVAEFYTLSPLDLKLIQDEYYEDLRKIGPGMELNTSLGYLKGTAEREH